MNKSILAVAALALISVPALHAGDDIIPLSRGGGIGVLRGGGNMYRPVPQTPIEANNRRQLATFYKPTQHFYAKDTVVSYRYVQDTGFGGFTRTTYTGPRGALYQASPEHLNANANIRSYAAVTKRPQPGVSMAPASAKRKRMADATVTPSGTSTIASAK